MSTEKTYAGYIFTITQGFKRGSNCWTNSLIPVSLTYLVYLSSSYEHQPTHDNSISYKANGGFTEINSNVQQKKLHKTNQTEVGIRASTQKLTGRITDLPLEKYKIFRLRSCFPELLKLR